MRDITFRTWDKLLSKMEFDSGEGELLIRQKSEPHWVLMQYIGKRDVNGKKIYDRDIIVYLEKGRRKRQRTVEWQSNSSRNGWNVYGNTSTNSEVIGNIYENPELLTK